KWEADQLAKMEAKGKVPQNDKWKLKYKEPPAPDTKALPELPEHWTWTSMDCLGSISGGVTKNSKRKQFPLQMPYLRVANVYSGELRLQEMKEIGVAETEIDRVLLQAGDLLIVEGNGSIDQIGRVAIWDGSIEPCLHQNHLIKIRFSPTEIGQYALRWMLSINGRKHITRVASSTSGLHTLSLSKVASIPIPLPPLSAQKFIVDEIEKEFSIINAIEQLLDKNLKRAEKLRQSILKKAFEGKLVPQDPNDEPASLLLERIQAEKVQQEAKSKKRKATTKKKKSRKTTKTKQLEITDGSNEGQAS
ncbi:restriction endonuclease subunit S, partial [Adonisia turfae]